MPNPTGPADGPGELSEIRRQRRLILHPGFPELPVIARYSEISALPENSFVPRDPGRDIVDRAVVGKEVVMKVSIWIAVFLERATRRIVFHNSAAPNSDENDILRPFH